MTRSLKWWMALGVVLVFLAGVATGLFAGARHARHRFVVRHGEMVGDRMREHLQRHLNLTPEQLQHLEPILEETAKRLSAIRVETAERVAETMEASHRRMAPHLTPEQQVKIEKMKERHLRMKQRHRRHHRQPES